MTDPANPSQPIWIDTGGTFTDCITRTPSGDLHRLKILSSSVLRGKIEKVLDAHTVKVSLAWPVDEDIFKGFVFRLINSSYSSTIVKVDLNENTIYLHKPLRKKVNGVSFEITSHEEAPVLAARLLTKTPIGGKFPEIEMRLGSTRGTNAILERKGARTALLVTKGFKDLFLIGNQQRPDLFALHIVKPEPLYETVLEINERIEADGTVLHPLMEAEITDIISKLKKKKIETAAVALLNSYKNHNHELYLKNAFAHAGFKYISCSHELSSQIKILSRAETTVTNAYLDPIIQNYVSGIRNSLSGAKLSIMTSAGSLVKSDSFFPKDSLLSGPAGGVVGAAKQASLSGIRKIIAFDMGGTSTDVSLYNDRLDYRFESEVGSHKILSPSLAIETIAAGGGSICDFDGHRLTVGPHSAGASPGPACYGAGGPLTLTDVNLLLGRLDPLNFAIPVHPEKSQEAFLQFLKKIKSLTGRNINPDQVLESLIQIANEKMAEAIRKISIRQGHDPGEFTLLSFGGAGGQHACALADMLNMTHVLIPYDAGLLSAYGIGHAIVEKFTECLVLQSWKSFGLNLDQALDKLYQEAESKLIGEGFNKDEITWKKSLLFLRFEGQDSSLEIDYHKGDNVIHSFREKYVSIFGHWIDREIEVDSLKVIASVKPTTENIPERKVKPYQPKEEKIQALTAHGKKSKSKVFRWENLNPGAEVEGPALIISRNSSVFLESGWHASMDAVLNLHLKRIKKSGAQKKFSAEASLELFTNRFTALAQEMGALLQRTSFSVNVKERLDFSCAVLDPDGYLVVNAPHIPVHLGSMGVCVREVMKVMDLQQGDVAITNHPAFGGSHLPDVTLIKPVYYKKKRIGFVANRAHHAEIGGRKPGSMPADATRLEEEGVILKPSYLVKRGIPKWEDLKQTLLAPPFPTRAVDENLADINGALAAVNLGERGLQELCRLHGEKEVLLHMKALRKHASTLLKLKIRTLKKNIFVANEKLDDGSSLQVKITRKGSGLTIDFTGSSSTHGGNLNATKAIVQSVVLYCLRLLVDQPLPMNEGLMEHVKLVIPEGLLNPNFKTEKTPAVVGGNTEVSQRLTDTLLKALGLAACSQGTMNNLLFGNSRFGYYETICGGTGAIHGFNGTHAVHQHMTNTRITDPEVMEFRYPVRLERFEIRKGSGGKGKWNGGDGVERAIYFKEALEINILSQHRKELPYGMRGGGPGKAGEQFIISGDGHVKKMEGMDSVSVNRGDTLIIRTPGGGAWEKSVIRGSVDK